MATKRTGGMWHPTVVPANFEAEDGEDEADREDPGAARLADR